MKKFAMAAVLALPLLSVLFTAPVFATSPGELATLTDAYQVRNLKDSTYSSSATATCDETLKFSLKLSNSEYGTLSNVMVKADLVGSVTASAVNAEGKTTSVSAKVNVNVTKGNLVYVAGSTTNLDVNGNVIRTLADGITAGGVNKGSLKGSTREFVQFLAKVNCPEEPKNIKVCELATKKIITIREDQFDASKHSKNLDDCKEVVKKIQVCELATKKVITIDEKNFDATKHSKDLEDCAEKPPVPGEIVVCEIATKNIVTIKENEFDDSKYTKDLSKCDETPVVPEMPTELPQTGATGVIALIASVIAAGIGYAVTARKNVLG